MRFDRNIILALSFSFASSIFCQMPSNTYVKLPDVAERSKATQIVSALAEKGYVVKMDDDATNHLIHLRIGPYTASHAESIRKRLLAQGYVASVAHGEAVASATDTAAVVPGKATEMVNSASSTASPTQPVAAKVSGLSPEQQRMEADALAKFGGSPPATPAGANDIEAQALAHLGLSAENNAPKTPAEMEAQALQAMQRNTAQNEIDEANRKAAAALAAQQAEADRLQREIESQQAAANAPPQQSTAASFLNSLNGVLSAGIDVYAQQQAANQAANQARLNQIAALRAQQAQIEANRAAEQRRQQQAAQAIATPSATVRPQTDSSATCDDARDHLPPGSTRSAYQGCIPYKGTQPSPVASSTAYSSPKQIAQVSSPVSSQAGSPVQAPEAKPNQRATASCRNMLYSVEMTSQWTDAKKTEVVGFIDNNSIGTANCVWAFHKNGQWTDYGSMNIASGKKHVGGEFGGIWSTGTDSYDIKYACFEGPDAVDAEGLSCIAQVKFIGPTKAGTDKY